MPWDWRHCVHVRPHAVECDSLTCPRELRVDLPKKSTLLERTNGDEPRYVTCLHHPVLPESTTTSTQPY